MSTSKRPSGSIPATWIRRERRSICPGCWLRCWKGSWTPSGNGSGRQLFKQAVDENLMANLVVFYFEMDEDLVRKLRVKCVKNVKETNGEIDFLDALQYQKGARE